MNIKLPERVCVFLVVLGAIIQLVTSTISHFYKGVPLNSYESVEEYLWFSGQALGELFYLISISVWINKYKIPSLFFILMIDLSIIDCCDVLFYNPFIHNWSKTVSIIIVTVYSLVRLYFIFKKKK